MARAFGGATREEGRRETRIVQPTLSAYGSKVAHERYGGFGMRCFGLSKESVSCGWRSTFVDCVVFTGLSKGTMDGGSGMFYFIQSVLQEYFIGGGTDESDRHSH